MNLPRYFTGLVVESVRGCSLLGRDGFPDVVGWCVLRGPVSAAAMRGRREQIEGVIFDTDRESTYTATAFTQLCKDKLGIHQSMGRVGSCFDNATAEAFFSTLEWEVLSRHTFTDPNHAKVVVIDWCYDFYNQRRRHSSANMMSTINDETASVQPDAA